MQWLQDPNQSNVDNLYYVRHEASRHFRNKKKEYMKAKIDELQTNSNITNIRDLYRDITDFNPSASTSICGIDLCFFTCYRPLYVV